ncbi:hypothetical protein ACFE04_022419 [Oxalis oulophora]
MSWKSKGGFEASSSSSRSLVSKKWAFLLCIACFCAGMLFSDRIWEVPEVKDLSTQARVEDGKMKLVSEGCGPASDVKQERKDLQGEVLKTHHAIQTLDKTISNLEMELAAARAAQESIVNGGSPLSGDINISQSNKKRKYLMVIGINTAFSSRKRRDSVRETWMPQGENRKKLEEEKGIVVRFVIGHSATSGGILDRAIEAEDQKHGDFLRLVLHSTLGATLTQHRSKPRVYIGCMKSGPVLAQKGVRYHEPEHWKFGEEGNKYFRHATGQLYAISKDLATYISINQHILHKYTNEDVSLGSWFIGLDTEHIDDRRLCCGTPPDCEWKAQAGNICVASFDWSCSGICKSADRIKEVHRRCGEGENALWNTEF